MTTEIEAAALAIPEPAPAPVTIFGTDDPRAIVERIAEISVALAAEIKRRSLSNTIRGREYIREEGWAFCGAMLGIFPRTGTVTPLPDGTGFDARVDLLRGGVVVGGAIAECSRAETKWAEEDTYAIKSMAQTRAAGKAFRMALGFIACAAGYEATPAEEMPADDVAAATSAQPAAAASCPQHGAGYVKQRVARGGPYREREVWSCSHNAGSGEAPAWCAWETPVAAPAPTRPPPPAPRPERSAFRRVLAAAMGEYSLTQASLARLLGCRVDDLRTDERLLAYRETKYGTTPEAEVVAAMVQQMEDAATPRPTRHAWRR